MGHNSRQQTLVGVGCVLLLLIGSLLQGADCLFPIDIVREELYWQAKLADERAKESDEPVKLFGEHIKKLSIAEKFTTQCSGSIEEYLNKLQAKTPLTDEDIRDAQDEVDHACRYFTKALDVFSPRLKHWPEGVNSARWIELWSLCDRYFMFESPDAKADLATMVSIYKADDEQRDRLHHDDFLKSIRHHTWSDSADYDESQSDEENDEDSTPDDGSTLDDDDDITEKPLKGLIFRMARPKNDDDHATKREFHT